MVLCDRYSPHHDNRTHHHIPSPNRGQAHPYSPAGEKSSGRLGDSHSAPFHHIVSPALRSRNSRYFMWRRLGPLDRFRDCCSRLISRRVGQFLVRDPPPSKCKLTVEYQCAYVKCLQVLLSCARRKARKDEYAIWLPCPGRPRGWLQNCPHRTV